MVDDLMLFRNRITHNNRSSLTDSARKQLKELEMHERFWGQLAIMEVKKAGRIQ